MGLMRRANALRVHILVVHDGPVRPGDIVWCSLLERLCRVGDGQIPQLALPDIHDLGICTDFENIVLDSLSNRMPYLVQCASASARARSGESSRMPVSISTDLGHVTADVLNNLIG